MLNRIFVGILLGISLIAAKATEQDFTYTTNNGAITITGYKGGGGAVTIPSAIGGRPVTSIGVSAFDSSAVTSVILPNSVTAIAARAFSNCGSLTNIQLSAALRSIDFAAFFSCSRLESITLPASLIEIGSSVFYACMNFRAVNIPKSVSLIGARAFQGCTGLTEIRVETENVSYTDIGGVLFNKQQTTLIQFPPGKGGEYLIPATVVTINDNAFQLATNLTAITIPDGVRAIGSQAFYQCTNLRSIRIPNSVTQIGDTAFFRCTRLVSVTLGEGVTSIGVDQFYGCTALENVNLGSRVDSLQTEAFYLCSNLKTITLPASLGSLGPSAFGACTNLRSLFFLGRPPSLGGEIFPSTTQSINIIHQPGIDGWGATYAGRPAVPWKVEIISGTAVSDQRFELTVTSSHGTPLIIQATPSLSVPIWASIATNVIEGGRFTFIDTSAAVHPTKSYRVRSP